MISRLCSKRLKTDEQLEVHRKEVRATQHSQFFLLTFFLHSSEDEVRIVLARFAEIGIAARVVDVGADADSKRRPQEHI